MKCFTHRNNPNGFIGILRGKEIRNEGEERIVTSSGQMGLAHLSHRGP